MNAGRRLVAISLVLCGVVCTLTRALAGQSPVGRAMPPEDLLSIQSIGRTTLSPDAKWVAVVVRRPATRGEYYRNGLGSDQRADVWLARLDGGEAVNLTHGDVDHAGYWEPVWSP